VLLELMSPGTDIVQTPCITCVFSARCDNWVLQTSFIQDGVARSTSVTMGDKPYEQAAEEPSALSETAFRKAEKKYQLHWEQQLKKTK
jgi:hypothetical protein